jgi:hypothetical protein
MEYLLICLAILASLIFLPGRFIQRRKEKRQEKSAWKARSILKQIREDDKSIPIDTECDMVRLFAEEGNITLEQLGTSQEELDQFEKDPKRAWPTPTKQVNIK